VKPKPKHKFRFTPERSPKDDAEFVHFGLNGRAAWYVHAHGLPLLGPYADLAHAWAAWSEMDRKERDLLKAVRRDRTRRLREAVHDA